MDRITETPGPPNPVEPAEPTDHSDGIDITLVRWMLSLTPGERLAVLQSSVDAIVRMRGDRADR